MICKWCKKDIGDVHKNRKYCSTSCMDKARYAKSGQRSTKIQRSLWYKSRCLKEGHKEKLRKQENLRSKKVKDFLAEYKLNRGCKDCGYKEHHSSLEFDHTSGKKERNVCFAKSIGQAKKEIEKCEVVCSNCHRIRTYKRIYPKFDKIIENQRSVQQEQITLLKSARLTVDMVVRGFLSQGYKEVGGSDVFRILRNPENGQEIKVYYDNYIEPGHIVVRESVESRPCGNQHEREIRSEGVPNG